MISVKLDNPKFWGTTTVDDMDEIPNPEGVAALRTRVIEFSGKFEPVKWSCRAPLPNGKLCPRKDRVKVSSFLLYLINSKLQMGYNVVLFWTIYSKL